MPSIIVIPLLAVLLALPAAAQEESCRSQEPCPENPPAPEVCKRLCRELSFASADGSFRQGRVEMQQWQIANGQKVEIPHQGMLIVHLRAGSLAVVAGDEREEWPEDSYWSVPPGTSLIVQTDRDSVVLQTVDFIDRDEPGRCVDYPASP